MLISIGRKADPAPDDPVSRLLSCHQKIRHFTSVALALGEAGGAPLEEIAAAAAGVARYFADALPLHAADEDLSIAPRLIAITPLAGALAAMTAQHATIDATLSELLPLWRAVEADPRSLPHHAEPLVRLATRLSAQWDEHLAPEEATIFPEIAARLTREDRVAIVGEMVARRGGAHAVVDRRG